MRIHRDCLPCIRRQINEAVQMAACDGDLILRINAETDRILDRYEDHCCTPDLVAGIYNVISEISGNTDPYKDIKERDIKAALSVYPLLKFYLEDRDNDVTCALNIAATGNIIDAAVNKDLDIKDVLLDELSKPLICADIDMFTDKLANHPTILIIGDNSGETVFDRVLAESLSADIIYAVRSKPVLNDATMQEALDSGLDGCAVIVSTGCNAPGAILRDCSTEFQRIFYSADIVISKGQGNYEALSDVERDVFFLLKAKCPVISAATGVQTGDHVFKYKCKLV